MLFNKIILFLWHIVLIYTTLTRKYPINTEKVKWSLNLSNCRLEASDDSLFEKGLDTLHVIVRSDADLRYTQITFPSPVKHRYWRLHNPGKHIQVGELNFYDINGHEVEGRVIPDASEERLLRAFDGNVLTYSNAQTWIGIDFGQAVEIASFGYISRTDANGIIPGMEYELCCFG